MPKPIKNYVETRGGRRNPPGGRPPGIHTPHATTIAAREQKAVALQTLREMVIAKLGPLVDSQIASAIGRRHLVTRDETGRFRPVRQGELELLNAEGKVIEILEDQPSTPAFNTLMDRALDKPTEMIQASVELTGGLEDRLKAGRDRVARARGNGHSKR